MTCRHTNRTKKIGGRLGFEETLNSQRACRKWLRHGIDNRGVAMKKTREAVTQSSRAIFRLAAWSGTLRAGWFGAPQKLQRCSYDSYNNTLTAAIRSSAYHNKSQFVFYRNNTWYVGSVFPFLPRLWYRRVKAHYDQVNETYHIRMVENRVSPLVVPWEISDSPIAPVENTTD